MEKYITDERTGLKYELVGDYYLVAGEDEPTKPLGKWGQRRRRYLREHKRVIYDAMLISGRLETHLAEIDREAAEMVETLTTKMKALEGITEKLKDEDQMAWVRAVNNIRNRAIEIVENEYITV